MNSRERNLDELEARVLGGARLGLGPDEATMGLVLERLASTLGKSGAGSADGAAGSADGAAGSGNGAASLSESAAPSSGLSLKMPIPGGASSLAARFGAGALVGSAGAGLVVGALGGYWMGKGQTHEEARLGESRPLPVLQAIEPADRAAAETAATPEAEPGLRGDAPVRPPMKSRAAKEVPAESEVELSFYGELSFLTRAQAALRDGNGALALGLMDSLDKKPNKGALWTERRVTRALALCQLGREEEAAAVARAVMSMEGARVYQKRLLSSCVGNRLDEGQK